jgi:hypothetical protein
MLHLFNYKVSNADQRHQMFKRDGTIPRENCECQTLVIRNRVLPKLTIPKADTQMTKYPLPMFGRGEKEQGKPLI